MSPSSAALGAEPLVRIVLAKQDAVFRPACEHPVGFVGAFCDEVVNEDADVGFISSEGKCVTCSFA